MNGCMQTVGPTVSRVEMLSVRTGLHTYIQGNKDPLDA